MVLNLASQFLQYIVFIKISLVGHGLEVRCSIHLSYGRVDKFYEKILSFSSQLFSGLGFSHFNLNRQSRSK